MTYTLEQLAERLHACEVDLEAHRGYLKAMEYALGATIATHSDPPSLRRIWDLMLVEAADTHATSMARSSPLPFSSLFGCSPNRYP